MDRQEVDIKKLIKIYRKGTTFVCTEYNECIEKYVTDAQFVTFYAHVGTDDKLHENFKEYYTNRNIKKAYLSVMYLELEFDDFLVSEYKESFEMLSQIFKFYRPKNVNLADCGCRIFDERLIFHENCSAGLIEFDGDNYDNVKDFRKDYLLSLFDDNIDILDYHAIVDGYWIFSLDSDYSNMCEFINSFDIESGKMAHITYVNEQCITFYIDESCHIIGDTKNNIIMSNNKYDQDKEVFDYICANYGNLTFGYDKDTMYFGLYDVPEYLCQTYFKRIHDVSD